jgi:hypothetical protein
MVLYEEAGLGEGGRKSRDVFLLYGFVRRSLTGEGTRESRGMYPVHDVV